MSEQIQNTQANNKRIAKNTLLLYFRMILIMAVNLYSSRVILQVLGVEDYGTYNVVGGVVAMLSFINSSLAGGSSRFITFELGKGKDGNAEKMFRCSATIFYIFSIVCFVLLETIGLWFALTQLNIPEGRETAVFWVYQCSVITFIVSLLSVTYNALIIAQEHMGAFAYISVFEAITKLCILFLLPILPFDRLICYAVLLMLIQLAIRTIYTIYCNKHFEEVNNKWLWDRNISREFFTYVAWSVNGHIAYIGYTQGINILLNIYFGPVVNAARAIATQIQSALSQFYASFQTAIRPQVIKSYAQGNYEYMHMLVLKSARLSFLLSIIVSVPVFTFADYILNLWLVNPPEHVVAFARLTIIAGLSASLSQHTLIAIHATGDIKKFQIIEGGCLLLILPTSWVLLRFFGVSSEMVIGVYVIIEILTQLVRVVIVYPRIQLRISRFFTEVLIKPMICLALISSTALLIQKYNAAISFLTLIIDLVVLGVVELFFCFFIGVQKGERQMVTTRLTRLIRK